MTRRHDLALTLPDGSERTLRGDERETILDVAERNHLGLPFGCRTGACATCVGRLVEGAVTYERPPRALKRRHVRDGYVLCCVARPRTDCRIESGPAVHRELLGNPWR